MANHPHDKNRPESGPVKKALAADDMEALALALSPLQLAFCKEYVVDFNGAAAAIRAGYSPKWADRQANQLMRNAGVRRYIEFLMTSKEAKIVSVTPDYLIQQLTTVMNKEGVRDSDKIRATELLMKHLGMFIDRTEITGKDGEAIRIEKQRVEEEAASFADTIRRMAKKKEVTLD